MGKKLTKSPLLESIFEVIIGDAYSPIDYTILLSKFHSKVSGSYPNIEALPGSQVPYGLLPEPPIVRHRFLSSNKTDLVNLGENIISVNTTQYKEYEDFIKSIEEVMGAYKETTDFKIIKRLGLRYINQFNLSEIKLEDILSFNVSDPKFIQGENETYDLLYIFKKGEYTLNYRMIKNPASHPNSLIIDIDVFSMINKEFSIEETMVWNKEAHNYIKDTFTGSLKQEFLKTLE